MLNVVCCFLKNFKKIHYFGVCFLFLKINTESQCLKLCLYARASCCQLRHKQTECGGAVALKIASKWIIDRENLDIKEDIILTEQNKCPRQNEPKKKVVGYFPAN